MISSQSGIWNSVGRGYYQRDGSVRLRITLDTNIFYDAAEAMEGARDFEAIVSHARESKVELYCTPTTDFADTSASAARLS